MIDRFVCPIQDTGCFSFDICRKCKFFTSTNGKSLSVKCSKNKSRTNSQSFEAAFFLDLLGMPYEIEITGDKEL